MEEPGVECAECHLEIRAGEGRYSMPNGKSYHPPCYEAIWPESVTATVIQMFEQELQQIARTAGKIVAAREGDEQPAQSVDDKAPNAPLS